MHAATYSASGAPATACLTEAGRRSVRLRRNRAELESMYYNEACAPRRCCDAWSSCLASDLVRLPALSNCFHDPRPTRPYPTLSCCPPSIPSQHRRVRMQLAPHAAWRLGGRDDGAALQRHNLASRGVGQQRHLGGHAAGAQVRHGHDLLAAVHWSVVSARMKWHKHCEVAQVLKRERKQCVTEGCEAAPHLTSRHCKSCAK